LGYGTNARPDAKMGAEATEAALAGSNPISGNVGGGTGATVGKMGGMKRGMKAGIGYSAVQLGGLKLGAVVVVNALGDIYDHTNAKKLAGLMDPERKKFVSGVEQMYLNNIPLAYENGRSNTTIGAIICNGKFTQAELTKIAEMARSGYARCINPVATMADGDTIYVAATGKLVNANLNMVGTLAAEVMARAIKDAVKASAISNEEYLKNVK